MSTSLLFPTQDPHRVIFANRACGDGREVDAKFRARPIEGPVLRVGAAEAVLGEHLREPVGPVGRALPLVDEHGRTTRARPLGDEAHLDELQSITKV